MLRISFLMFAVVGCLASTASAAIIDVPAVGGPGGNVVNSATNSDSDYFWAGPNNANDNLWTPDRGALLTHTISNEDSPEIKQTFNGLDPAKKYRIYANGIGFWNQATFPSAYYTVAAALEGNPIQTYLIAPGEADQTFTPLQMFLGTVQGTSSVSVIADDFDVAAVDADTGSPKRTNRTYYAGLAYEVIPEPSSVCMLVAGVVLMAFRRRC